MLIKAPLPFTLYPSKASENQSYSMFLSLVDIYTFILTPERPNFLVLLWVVPLKTAPSFDKFINSHSASAKPLSFNSSLLESLHWVCIWRYFAL